MLLLGFRERKPKSLGYKFGTEVNYVCGVNFFLLLFLFVNELVVIVKKIPANGKKVKAP